MSSHCFNFHAAALESRGGGRHPLPVAVCGLAHLHDMLRSFWSRNLSPVLLVTIVKSCGGQSIQVWPGNTFADGEEDRVDDILVYPNARMLLKQQQQQQHNV